MRPVADDAVRRAAREVDAHAEAVVERDPLERDRPVVVVVEQRLGPVQLAQRLVADGGVAGQQPQLIERGAGVDPHRERLRRDLQIERPAIARRDLVEARRAVGDDTGEDVESAGGALGVRAPAHVAGQRQRFQQRHQVDRAALQRGALGQGHAVDHEVGVAVAVDPGPSRGTAGSWRAADRRAVRGEDRGSPAGTARRRAGRGRRDPARLDRGAQRDVRQDAGAGPIGRRGVSVAHAVHLSQQAAHRTLGVHRERAGAPLDAGRTQRGLHGPRHRLGLIASRRRAATAPRPRARSPAHRPARGVGHGRHPGKQSQAIGLVQAVVERGLEHVEPPGLQAGQQQRDALHVEHGVLPWDRRRAARRAPRPWRWSRSGTSTTQRTVAGTGSAIAVTRPSARPHDTVSPPSSAAATLSGCPSTRAASASSAVARERLAEQRVARDQASDPRRRARAQAARGRNAVDARQRAALERTSGRLVGQLDAARDDVVLVGRQSARALALHGHRHRAALLRRDLVVERQGQAERVEAGAQVGRRGRNTNVDGERAAQSRFSSHSGVSEIAQELSTM